MTAIDLFGILSGVSNQNWYQTKPKYRNKYKLPQYVCWSCICLEKCSSGYMGDFDNKILNIDVLKLWTKAFWN